MADISVIKLPSGSTYNIKDAQARTDIASLQSITTGAMHFRGTTTTAITDGSTTATITIDGESVTLTSNDAGAVVIYGTTGTGSAAPKEFVWNGTKWNEFGSTGSIKALAFKDTASGTVTPTGSVTSNFTGGSSNVTITTEDSATGNYQPAGTVNVSTNTTTDKTATVSPVSGTATYTPAGTINTPTFTGTAATINSSGAFTPQGEVALSNTNKTATVSAAQSGTVTYTPEGTVTAPTISIANAGSTTTIKNPTSTNCAKTVVAVAPGETEPANALTWYSVSGETLSLYQLGYTVGASITTTNVTVKDGDAQYQASAPEFNGTGKRLVTSNISIPSSASFTGTEGTVNVQASYTPAGTNEDLTFSGTGVRLQTGKIAVPNTYTASFTGTKTQISGTTTANGSVTSTFSGDEKTVTVS